MTYIFITVNKTSLTKKDETPKLRANSNKLSPRKKKIARRSNDKSSKENKNSATKSTQNHQSPKKSTTASTSNIENEKLTVTPKKNAFEFMMNARNKSIGTNSPGKDLGSVSKEKKKSPVIDAEKAKRKLMLEEWADRKGGAKRKIREDESGEYINNQMDKRAKRLKKLLRNSNGKNTSISSDIEVIDDSTPSEEVAITPPIVKFNFKKVNLSDKSKKSKKRIQVLDSDSEDDTPLKDYASKAKQFEVCQNNKAKRDSSTLSMATLETNTIKDGETKTFPANVEKTPTKCVPKTPSKSVQKTPSKVVQKTPSKVIQKTPSKCLQKTPSKTPKTLDTVQNKTTPRKSDSFTAALSSPIKKRDSLLGYFSKVAKSPTAAEQIPADVIKVIESQPVEMVAQKMIPKKRGRKSKTNSPATVKMEQNQESTTASESKFTTNSLESSGRPKRHCREKVMSYTVDLESSPSKVAAQKSLKRAKRILSSSPQTSPVKASSVKLTKTHKLAPIFVKAPAKPVIDPQKVRARQEFLMSGIPEKMKLEIERQRLFENAYECEIEIFPLVSHVTQLDKVQKYQESLPALHFRKESSTDDLIYKEFKCGPKVQRITEAVRTLVTQPKPNLEQLKLLMKSLKEADTTKFPYYRCFKQLRKKCPNSAQDKLSDDEDDDDDVKIIDDVDVSCELIETQCLASNGATMFTERYKPCTSDEILVNAGPVMQLKKFLSAWQENDGRRSDSSDDDFDLGGTSSASGFGTGLNKSVVLLGPHGCGKTNAVYSLANEMCFNVLEINAGRKRTGKKILMQLQEATQSHQVKSGSGTMEHKLFRSLSTATPSTSEESSNGYGASQSTEKHKLSLILIEDADITFEQDFGFIDAMYQLVATSKRPVILIANDHNSLHLSRFIEHNAIYFCAAPALTVSKWLTSLSIVENCYVSSEQCERLYVYNGRDFRKTLLEMQFFIQSGGDPVPSTVGKNIQHQKLYSLFTVDQNRSSKQIPQPVDFEIIAKRAAEVMAPTKKTFKNIKQNSIDGSSLSDALEFYENIAAAQRIQNWRPCEDRLVNSLTEEIAHEMVDMIVRKHKPIEKGNTFVIESRGKQMTPESR